MPSASNEPWAVDPLDVVVNQVGIGSAIDKGGTGQVETAPSAPPLCGTPRVDRSGEVVVAVFLGREPAALGLRLLAQAGLPAEHCGLLERAGPLTHARGLLARAGCADAGPAQALRRLGLAEEVAQLYQQAFEAWQPLLVVHGRAQAAQAMRILQAVARPQALRRAAEPQPLTNRKSDGRPTPTSASHRSSASQRRGVR